MDTVAVIAGTSDAREIINELVKLEVRVVATVATAFGKELIEESGNLKVYDGKLDLDGMVGFLRDTGVKCVVDASHPYAQNVSRNAIVACERAGVAYIRFERDETEIIYGKLIRVKSFDEAADEAAKLDGNIFLTVGSNSLEIFTKKIPGFKERLFVRALTEGKVLLKCEEAGLTANNILAVKGPFSEEMNVQMLRHCNASVVVTKNSGKSGGTEEKVAAARKLGIPVVLVERPEIEYPVKVDCIDAVLEFVRKQLAL